ncbi:myosin II light chain [Mitosporidium daphniae]
MAPNYYDAKEVFSIFSIQGGGEGLKIPTAKVGDCLRAMGNFPSEAQIKETEKMIDPLGSGWVDEESFLSFVSGMDRASVNVVTDRSDLINCFKILDKEGSGLVKLSDLKHILTTVGEKMASEDVDSLYRLLGYSNVDMAVSYEGKSISNLLAC